MAIISFAHTTRALLAGEKTVTRRTWKRRHMTGWQQWYDEGRRVHDAWDQLPIQGGEKVAEIKLTERPYLEPLGEMPEEDLEREGGFADSLEEFFGFWDIDRSERVAVVRFELVDTFASPSDYRRRAFQL